MILSSIFILLITIIISFAGSVQLGPVNITVIRTAITKNYQSAVFIGLGGALPELIYSSIAIKGAEFLERFPTFLNVLTLICIPLFILVGIYFIFKKQKATSSIRNTNEQRPKNIIKSLLLGFSIGMINPMLLPFWIVVLSTYHSYGLMLSNNLLDLIGFVLGTALGAFLLQYLIVILLKKYTSKFEKVFMKYANPVTGWMFVLLGVVQFIQLYY